MYVVSPYGLTSHTEQDCDKAERLVHNIAGVAGSFDAISLMNISRDIEHFLQNSEGDIKTLQMIFSQELSNFISAIHQLHNEQVA